MCPTMPPILSFSASPGRWSLILVSFLPLVVIAKSVNVYGLCKRFLPTLTQVSNCYSVDCKLIYYLNNMILHFFQGILWCFSYPVERIWEDLISLTTFMYRHKLTWQDDVQRCKKLHATVWQKLITVAKGKAKIEMSPFSWLVYKCPLKQI